MDINNAIHKLLRDVAITQKQYDILFEDKTNWFTEVDGTQDWSASVAKIELFDEALKCVVNILNTKSSIDLNYIHFPPFSFKKYKISTEKDINFRFTIFSGDADFESTTFSNANFNRAIFNGKANFAYTSFKDDANFLYSTFMDTADFLDSEFKMQVNFMGAKFNHVARFTVASFHAKAHFLNVTFSSEVDFMSSIFYDEGFFGNTKFGGYINYDDAQFNKILDLNNIN